MKRVASKCALASMVIFAFAVSMAYAKFPGIGHSSENDKSVAVQIVENLQVPNGPTLQPGNYRVMLMKDAPQTEVQFYEQGKLVGQAPAQLVNEQQRNSETELQIDNASGTGVLNELDVAGWSNKIEFGQGSPSSGSSR